MKTLKAILAIAILGVMMVVVWKFKWFILGGTLAYVLIMMSCNHFYRKATGKNMKIYDRIMND